MKPIYHKGEQNMLNLAGEREAAERSGKEVAEKIPKRVINFIEKQPMVIVSKPDYKGKIWTSLLVGDLYFVSVQDPKTL